MAFTYRATGIEFTEEEMAVLGVDRDTPSAQIDPNNKFESTVYTSPENHVHLMVNGQRRSNGTRLQNYRI